MRRIVFSQFVTWLFVFHVLCGCCVQHGHEPIPMLHAAGFSSAAPCSSAGHCAHQHSRSLGSCHVNHCLFVRSKGPSELERAVGESAARHVIAPNNLTPSSNSSLVRQRQIFSIRAVPLHVTLRVLLI